MHWNNITIPFRADGTRNKAGAGKKIGGKPEIQKTDVRKSIEKNDFMWFKTVFGCVPVCQGSLLQTQTIDNQ